MNLNIKIILGVIFIGLLDNKLLCQKLLKFNLVWKNYNINNGLAGDLILDIKADKFKILWILNSKGLNYIKNNQIFQYSTDLVFDSIIIYNGKCILRQKNNKTYFSPYNNKLIKDISKINHDNDRVYNPKIKNGFLINKEGEKLFDKKVEKFVIINDIIYLSTNGEGIWYSDICLFGICKLYNNITNTIFSDICSFNNYLFFGDQEGKIYKLDSHKLYNIYFMTNKLKSPSKFYVFDSVMFCYTGYINRKNSVFTYKDFYYCCDVNNLLYLQLGYYGGNLIFKGNNKIFKSFLKNYKISNILKSKNYIWLKTNVGYYKLCLNKNFELIKEETKFERYFINDSLEINKINDTIEVKTNNYKIYISCLLKQLIDIKVKDSIIFLTTCNAFYFQNIFNNKRSKLFYYSDLYLKNSYVSSCFFNNFFFILDGTNLLKIDLNNLKVETYIPQKENFLENFFSYFYQIKNTKSNHYYVLYKNGLPIKKYSILDNLVFINKINFGYYYLKEFDNYGNEVETIRFQKVSIKFFVILAGIFALILLILIISFINLKNKILSIKSKNLMKKEIAFNIEFRKKISYSIPHLYNNLFQGFSKGDSSAQILHTISDFSYFLLEYNSKEVIFLDEEINFCRHYHELYSISKPLLKFHMKIINNTNTLIDDIEIPTFIIQPIIENSFKRFNDNKIRNVYLILKINNNNLMITLFDDFSKIEGDISYRKKFGIDILNERLENLSKLNKKRIAFDFRFREKTGVCTKISIPFK